ncbi:hypothetical protein BAT_1418 [Bacillus pumilus ATCC 7061]|nr:hypothetical protein BAT_1418 [Bacillus pumilus ATCC 7061]
MSFAAFDEIKAAKGFPDSFLTPVFFISQEQINGTNDRKSAGNYD